MFYWRTAFRYDSFMKRGKFINNGVILQDNEEKTIDYLLWMGFDISLIPRSIILDLRLMKGSQNNALSCARYEFYKYSYMKRMIVIMKCRRLIDIAKQPFYTFSSEWSQFCIGQAGHITCEEWSQFCIGQAGHIFFVAARQIEFWRYYDIIYLQILPVENVRKVGDMNEEDARFEFSCNDDGALSGTDRVRSKVGYVRE